MFVCSLTRVQYQNIMQKEWGTQYLMAANVQPNMLVLDLRKVPTNSKSDSDLTKFYTRTVCKAFGIHKYS